jgi:hypothetical protein
MMEDMAEGHPLSPLARDPAASGTAANERQVGVVRSTAMEVDVKH